MINITLSIPNVADVLTLYNSVQLYKYIGTGTPDENTNISQYIPTIGTDKISNRTNVSDILLSPGYTSYYFFDSTGSFDSWYIERYFNTGNNGSSGWSSPFQGAGQDLLYNPIYPPEIDHTSAEKLIINRLRILIGDPIGIDRVFGPDAEENLFPDRLVYELPEKGWPCSINIYGNQYANVLNPTVNGYRYLKFYAPVDTSITTVSGIDYSIDIWYNTFRHSDKEIMGAYDNCPPPTPLNSSNCTSEVFMLQTAYDLLQGETWEVISEGAIKVVDDTSSFDPSPGITARKDLLLALRTRLDAAIKGLTLAGITGVRVE